MLLNLLEVNFDDICQVHVHGCSLASLHTVVEPELLPREYGGTDGTLQDLIGESPKDGKVICKNWESKFTFYILKNV